MELSAVLGILFTAIRWRRPDLSYQFMLELLQSRWEKNKQVARSAMAGCSTLTRRSLQRSHGISIPSPRTVRVTSECSAASCFAVRFNFMRSTLCTLAILSLWIPQANAQSAVLIGVHVNVRDDDGTGHPPRYRTFLITFRDGKAQLAADIPDLIVPRKDGFWRVGAVHQGAPGKYGSQEFVYAVPARSVPQVGEYHPDNPDWSCSETDQATIEFVNPDLLSVSYFTEPACSLQVEYRHGTYELDDLGKELDITAVLGPAAWEAQKKADTHAKAEDNKSPDCVGISKPDSTNWGIERSGRLPGSKAKSWVLVSDFNAPHVCGDGDTYEIKFPIPESLTGPTYHAGTLSSLLQSKLAKDNGILPGEALLTPAGDFLVAFGYGESARIFGIKQQGIELKPALSASTKLESNVVMVQWALGKHVREWESELQSLQATHLPEPIVVIGKPQS